MRCARSLRALQVAPWVNKEIAAAAEHPLARSIQDLAIEARQASAKNVRDPFLWQGIRLRARSAAPVLQLHHVAAFLGSSVKVGLVDEAFLTAMAGRLDTLLRWAPGTWVAAQTTISSRPSYSLMFAMRLIFFLPFLPMGAAIADCKGNVAGDKIWMCPDVDVKECPLTYASTGFSPEYIQCGVAGRLCVSLGPLCQPK
eukprot:symbB.v1.2.016506.t1/scaffold1211.1/size131413/4